MRIRVSKSLVLFCILILQSLRMEAQTDSLAGEKGFNFARKLAFNGKRQEARKILKQLLVTDPDYSDAAILMGRTFAWDDKYDSARIVLKKVVALHQKNKDALDALIDVELWSDHPDNALRYADQGLKTDPFYEDFMVKKIRALVKIKQTEQAVKTADSMAIASGNHKVRELSRSLRADNYKNNIVFTADVDLFSNTFTPWYYSSLSYGRKTDLFGTLIGRINYANRFNENGWQGEVDAYPSLGKKMYAYLNAGYSPSLIFPVARGGFSLYYNLPKAFEAELGVRYLYFSNGTLIYTGSVGKYYKDFWFSLRTYVTPGGSNVSQSYYLQARYYMGNADNYLTLRLGTGLSPDERANDVVFYNPADQLLSSKSIKIDFQKGISWNYFLSLRASYSYDEVSRGFYRGNPSFGLSLEKRF